MQIYLKIFGVIRRFLGEARGARPVYRLFPSKERCKECLAPFNGIFAIPFKILQIRRSRKNPYLCTMCYEFAPPGGEIKNISVVFIDVRGFTALAEQLRPDEVAERLNYFYWLAANAVFKLDGTLDKLIGDEVMAFFGAPFHPDDHESRAVEAAVSIVKGIMEVMGDYHFDVGGGVASGEAFVGNVGGGEIKDYTALGDVVNTASRLQSVAAAGQVIVTEETFRSIAGKYPDAEVRELELKGKSQIVKARVITVGVQDEHNKVTGAEL